MNRKLDDLAKQRVIGIVMAGGSREMVARYLNLSIKTIYNAIKRDAAFGKQLAEAEAYLSLRHRRAVQELDSNANRDRVMASFAATLTQEPEKHKFLRMLAGMT